ncbi:MAG TPA: serine/threonine-protein kinase [Vicinamibacterales bacterium]
METPRTIGRYEVIERVGRGGMGVLYRGRDPVLDREVAIKVMAGDFSTDEAARTRFFREARAAARLQHRNIVTVYEFAEDNGSPYIAMEFLRGQSLAQRLQTGSPMPLVQKLDIVIQLLTGLHYAHEQGIVHRDVKPPNIWLLDDGTIKLLDFGIAKIAASTMTSAGSVLGSAFYMAPEQVAGREVDGRADVFASGVVLYEMLSGHRPFEAESPTAVMLKIINEEPQPLTRFCPDLPPGIVSAVMKALSKDPAHRYPHAGDFAAELKLLRLAAERESETMQTESPDLAQTIFIPPTMAEAAPITGHPDPAGAVALPGDSGTAARQTVIAAPGSRLTTWLMIAAVAIAAVALAVALTSRGAPAGGGGQTASVGTPAGPANASAATSSPAPPPAPAPAAPTQPGSIRIVTDPEGARVLIGGRDAGLTTPADVKLEDVQKGRVRVSLRGYRSTAVVATAPQIEAGAVLVKLEAAPTGIEVDITGGYPFEVWDGNRQISQRASRHTLTVDPPRTLRLVAGDVLLNANVRVERESSGRASLQAPELGRLTLLTTHETCKVVIGGRDFGYPPLSDVPLAPGTHKIELRCPEGGQHSSTVRIQAGQSTRETIR